MIDLQNEKLISLAQATKLVPPARRGRRTHISTLCRWIVQGAIGPSGERVRLEAVRLPRGWMTSAPAVQRFLEALTPDLRQASEEIRPPRSPGARARASRRAEQELSKIGI